MQGANIDGLIVVMGVAGCGKSTVGLRLASELGTPFIEADELHPAANVEKMSRGQALNDDDRFPWLDAIVEQARLRLQQQSTCVVSCSALKGIYRDKLRAAHEQTRFVFLDGSQSLILHRMQKREGHFMPTSLLESQFATLENPADEADVISVSIEKDLEEIVQAVLTELL